MATQEEMNVRVPKKLLEIEEKYHVSVIYAAESGSRAWGFESPDSDFDVRFIYRRTREDYLRIEPVRDVIEEPIDDVWDVSGWDLRKALFLLRKSNPTVYEWLGSPITYCSDGMEKRIAPLLQEYFSEKSMMYHYLHTAMDNQKDFLRYETLKAKRYLYILRPLLACRWIMNTHSAPPVIFGMLAESQLPEELKDDVNHLLEIKMTSSESQEIAHIPSLDAYIEQSIQEFDEYLSKAEKTPAPGWDSLNEFFLSETEN